MRAILLFALFGVGISLILLLSQLNLLHYPSFQSTHSSQSNSPSPSSSPSSSPLSHARYTRAPPTYDLTSVPKYVKDLPSTVNPQLFAEVERRLENCEFLYNKTKGPLFLAPERGEWKYPDALEWHMLAEMILCEVPFSFIRQSDGEFAVMTGAPVSNSSQAKVLDRWEYKGGKGKLSTALQASLDSLPQNNGIIIQGFVCADKSWRNIFDYQFNATQQTTRFISHTYAFASCNFLRTKQLMNDIVIVGKLKQPVILIVNQECRSREHILKQWALDVLYLPDEFPTFWEEHGDTLLSTFATIARGYTGVLFLISGGPGAPPIQIAMSRANPWNQYISMGSILEGWAKGYRSRGDGPDPNYCLTKDGDGGCSMRKHPVTGGGETLKDYLAAQGKQT